MKQKPPEGDDKAAEGDAKAPTDTRDMSSEAG